MDTANTFFISLGAYNLLGVLILMLFLNQKIADSILRKHFQIFSDSYSVGKHGNLWLWWSIVLNLFFAGINLLAFRWDRVAQFDLLMLDLMIYLIFFILSIVATRSNQYDKGIWYNFPIFGFWLIWGGHLVFYCL